MNSREIFGYFFLIITGILSSGEGISLLPFCGRLIGGGCSPFGCHLAPPAPTDRRRSRQNWCVSVCHACRRLLYSSQSESSSSFFSSSLLDTLLFSAAAAAADLSSHNFHYYYYFLRQHSRERREEDPRVKV